VLTNTTPGTGSMLSLPVGKNSSINVILDYMHVVVNQIVTVHLDI
jgi:hypothetical protein